MGAEIQGVPLGAPVARPPLPLESFGGWLRRERELRDISIYYLAARVKLSPERVADLEHERASLRADGQGRALARSLALAIGADPVEAAGRLGPTSLPPLAQPRGPALRRLIDPLRASALAALLLAAWLGAEWWMARPSAAQAGSPVVRINYLDALAPHAPRPDPHSNADTER